MFKEDFDLEETFRRLSLNVDKEVDSGKIDKKNKKKDDMDVDEEEEEEDYIESVGEDGKFKQLVKRVLGNEFAHQRANKMNINDFLTLLACFNSANIHFT